MTRDSVIHVIDDDEAARDSLGFALKAAGFEVEIYESAREFLDSLQSIKGGCIITDVRMPELSGIDLLRQLKTLNHGTPVIVVTGHGDLQLAVEAMKIGAVDFLEKPYEEKALLASVRTVFERQNELSRERAEVEKIKERIAALSTREREVLDGLVAGHPNKVIAQDLDISPRTVEIYRANLMTKMKANSLSDLVRSALVAGVIKPSLEGSG
jgi:two-component system response regulator FixJ